MKGVPKSSLPYPQNMHGVGLLTQFPPFRYFPFFYHYQNSRQLLNVTFMFDSCYRNLTAVTPVKYERDSRNLTGKLQDWHLRRCSLVLTNILWWPKWPATLTASNPNIQNRNDQEIYPKQIGRHIKDIILKCICLTEYVMCVFRLTFLDFFPEHQINNTSSLVQVMACCRRGDKSLP